MSSKNCAKISTTESSKALNFNIVPLPNGTACEQDQHLQKIKNEVLPIEVESKPMERNGGICEEDLRNSLIVEAKRRKFWGLKTISKMVFEEVQHSTCHHYILESFTETRSVADATEPCSSGPVKTKSGGGGKSIYSAPDLDIGPAPSLLEHTVGTATFPGSSVGFGQNPWDFDIQPDEDFVNQIKILEMPSSHRLGPCHNCKAEGLSHCFHCRGFGTDKCTYCRGTGMKAGVAHPALYTHPMVGTFPHSDPLAKSIGVGPFSGSMMNRPAVLGASRDKPYAPGTPVHFMAKAGLPPPGIGQHDLCVFCHGRGIRDCQHCKGQGKKSCTTCGGQGQVRMYTKLKVTFSVESSDYYTPCEVPEILLRQAAGILHFSETQSYVQPIRKYSVKEINEVSRRLCSAHLKKMLDSCRVLKQRHCVETIEVAKVRFRVGSKTGSFYVYGKQRLCLIPNGPSKCSVM